MNKYVHIHKAFITIEKLRWTRIPGKEHASGHPHSFMRDGEDKEIVEVEVGKISPYGINVRLCASLIDVMDRLMGLEARIR